MRTPTSVTPARGRAFLAGLFADALGSAPYLPLTPPFAREPTEPSPAAAFGGRSR
jgi:hypothetical protein